MSDQPHEISTPWETFRKLKSLNVSTASGPDAVPNFVYKEFAEILACSISVLINYPFFQSPIAAKLMPESWQTIFHFQRKGCA